VSSRSTFKKWQPQHNHNNLILHYKFAMLHKERCPQLSNQGLTILKVIDRSFLFHGKNEQHSTSDNGIQVAGRLLIKRQ
jgi:hypothetical protein